MDKFSKTREEYEGISINEIGNDPPSSLYIFAESSKTDNHGQKLKALNSI